MIRVLHHMADAPAALRQVRNVLHPGACFILEFANKRNLKSILRYWLHLQPWNPFSPESVEFAPLNFDFHPRTFADLLTSLGFHIEKTLTVSYFRIDLLKRTIPPRLLAGLDSIFQWTGALGQFSPSVFVRTMLLVRVTSSGYTKRSFVSFLSALNVNIHRWCSQINKSTVRPVNENGILQTGFMIFEAMIMKKRGLIS